VPILIGFTVARFYDPEQGERKLTRAPAG
jgi:hypothetical protein